MIANCAFRIEHKTKFKVSRNRTCYKSINYIII